MRSRLYLFITALFACTAPTTGEGVRIVTWNVKDCMKVADVEQRANDFKTAFEELQPEILLIQEVTSQAVVERIAKKMGLDLNIWSIAVSDFAQSDGAHRGAFEVAIISKFPFTQVIEYDPSPDNSGDDPEELSLDPVAKIGIRDVRTSRGFLWANIADINLTIFVVHLKSSLGRTGLRDASNAEKRELVTAAVAVGVLEDLQFFPGYAHLVAGDFNVGCDDDKKNGSDLKVDCFAIDCDADRYDETHALLGAGLVGDLRMTNVVLPFATTSTFPSFGGSPIDNIYVTGPLSRRFRDTKIIEKTFNSDHRPVLTVFDEPN